MILSKRADIQPLLDFLELDFDRLIEAVRSADRDRALCTANDPRGFDLCVMNARTARGLREMFCGERWEADETDNQPGIRNPHLMIRVIPCNFDENAGNLLADPTNRTVKGAASRKKVSCNATGWLPNLPEPPAETESSGFTTYVLGSYFSSDTGLKAELCRPKSFSGGQYRKFEDRLVLLDGSEEAGGPISGSKQNGPTETVDIEIRRKA